MGSHTSRVLIFTTLVEAATGIGLLAVPGLVAQLLLGTGLPPAGAAVARCFAVALLALCVAAWPAGMVTTPAAVRAMLLYNAAIAGYLAWIGTLGALTGPLLWPAILVHAAVALLLASGLRSAPTISRPHG